MKTYWYHHNINLCKKISDSIFKIFNFLTGRIEFCIGLETLEDEHETIIIATGYYDNGTYLLKTNKQFINDFIKNPQDQNYQHQNPQHQNPHKTIKLESRFIPNLRNDNIEDIFKTHSLESQINDFVLHRIQIISMWGHDIYIHLYQ